jgi:hypothetical protein
MISDCSISEFRFPIGGGISDFLYSYKCVKSSVGATFSVTLTVDFTLQGSMTRAFTPDLVDA